MNSTFSRPLETDERIVILGDSITVAGNRPGGFATLLREAVGREELQWRPIGFPGDRIENAINRVASDVLPIRPTIVLVFVGVNDVWYQSRGIVLEFAKAKQDLTRLVAQLRSPASAAAVGDTKTLKSQTARRILSAPEPDAQRPPENSRSLEIVLCSPMLIGEKTNGSNSLDRDLEDLSDVIRQVSQEQECQFLDLRKHAIDYLKKHNPNQKSHSILTIDGVHLNDNGNRFLARTIAHYFEVMLPEPAARFLRHVVLLKFRSDANPAAIQTALELFQGLGTKIDSILSLESGTNISPEGKSHGYSHAFTLTFGSASDRDQYLPHPEHQHFIEKATPVIDDVCVFDYWANSSPTIASHET